MVHKMLQKKGQILEANHGCEKAKHGWFLNEKVQKWKCDKFLLGHT